jgi:hypothetical protein
MPDGIPPDELRKAVIEGLNQWLDKQFALFGRWTLAGLISAGLAGLVWLATHGGTFRP